MKDLHKEGIMTLPPRREMAPIMIHFNFNFPRLFHFNFHIKL